VNGILRDSVARAKNLTQNNIFKSWPKAGHALKQYCNDSTQVTDTWVATFRLVTWIEPFKKLSIVLLKNQWMWTKNKTNKKHVKQTYFCCTFCNSLRSIWNQVSNQAWIRRLPQEDYLNRLAKFRLNNETIFLRTNSSP